MNKPVKKSFIVIGLSALLVIVGVFAYYGSERVLGGVTNFTNGIVGVVAVRNENVATTTEAVTRFTVKDTIPLGSQSTSWRNDTGATVLITERGFYLDGVATGTFWIFAATSTESKWVRGGTQDARESDFSSSTAPSSVGNSSTYWTFISTSTPNSMYLNNRPTYVPSNATNTTTPLMVRPGDYLVWQVSAKPHCHGFPGVTSENTCEQATSTNRGFVVDWFFDAMATTTPSLDRR